MNGKNKEAIRVLGIGGSLRKGSYSMAVLRAAGRLLPDGAKFEVADLSGIPIFNQDNEPKPPQSVVKFKKQIREADAILFCTPEYNYGIPGYLKNAIDWASRPHSDNSFKDKPAAIISSSGGMFGGIKAQLQLREHFVYLDMHAVNDSIAVSNVEKKLDSDGELTDEYTIRRIKELPKELIEWTDRIAVER